MWDAATVKRAVLSRPQYAKSEEGLSHISEAAKKRMNRDNPIHSDRYPRRGLRSNSESWLEGLIGPMGWRWVGNRSVRVGRFFPDFMCADILLELTHETSASGPRGVKYADLKISHYKENGFPCLVVFVTRHKSRKLTAGVLKAVRLFMREKESATFRGGKYVRYSAQKEESMSTAWSAKDTSTSLTE
jgi:hypothetical protein